MKKLAIIRDQDTKCPYGLHINSSCKIAGDSVLRMTPYTEIPKDSTPEVIEKVHKENIKLLTENEGDKKHCVFAAHLFDAKPNVVDCDFGDRAAGMSQEHAFTGSDYYTKNLFPSSIDGLYSYPFAGGYDLGISRNQYYSVYQWASDLSERRIKRQAFWDTIIKK